MRQYHFPIVAMVIVVCTLLVCFRDISMLEMKQNHEYKMRQLEVVGEKFQTSGTMDLNPNITPLTGRVRHRK